MFGYLNFIFFHFPDSKLYWLNDLDLDFWWHTFAVRVKPAKILITNKLVLMWDCSFKVFYCALQIKAKKIISVTSYLLKHFIRIITFNLEVYFLSRTSLIFYINGNNVASSIILFFFLHFLVKLIWYNINYVWAKKESCVKLFCLMTLPKNRKALASYRIWDTSTVAENWNVPAKNVLIFSSSSLQ